MLHFWVGAAAAAGLDVATTRADATSPVASTIRAARPAIACRDPTLLLCAAVAGSLPSTTRRRAVVGIPLSFPFSPSVCSGPLLGHGLEELEGGVEEAKVLRRAEVVGAAQRDEAGVGQRGNQRIRRSGEVAVAEHDEHGRGDAPQLLDGQGLLRA